MIARDCPICAVPLEQETYEGFPIWRCPECHGTLLDFLRYEAIQSIPDTSLAELEAEAQAGFQGDNPNRIRCPRCRGVMDKRPLRVPASTLSISTFAATAPSSGSTAANSPWPNSPTKPRPLSARRKK